MAEVRQLNDKAAEVLADTTKIMRVQLTRAFTRAKTKAVAAGVSELDATNDAIAVLNAIAASALIHSVETLMQLNQRIDIREAMRIIGPDVGNRATKAMHAAMQQMDVERAQVAGEVNGVAND